MKNENPFHKLPAKWWFLLCLVIFILTQILIHPDILQVTYFYAEDGTIFFNGAKEGISAFITPWGGYLATASRLITAIAYQVMLISDSILAAGETIEIFSILTVALICTYFTSDAFNWLIKSRTKRLMLMLLLIFLMLNFINMFYNTVDLHWWFGIFAFFVSLNLIHNQEIKWSLIPFVILAVLSSPSTFFIIFPCLYSIITYKTKSAKIKSSLILLALAIQAVFVFFVPSQLVSPDVAVSLDPIVSQPLTDSPNPLDWLDGTILSVIYAPLYLFSAAFKLSITGFSIVFAAICGLILWLIPLLIKRKDHQFLKSYFLALIAVFTIYGMITLKSDFINGVSSFYHSTTAGIILILYGILISNAKKLPYLIYILTPPLLALHTIRVYPIELTPNYHLEIVDPYIDHTSSTTTRISITPNRGIYANMWYVDVPVNENYFKTYRCLEE